MRKIDVAKLKRTSTSQLKAALKRAEAAPGQLLFQRWVFQMTAVEVHGIWERYVEDRLVAALNHDPAYFLEQQSIRGVTHVSSGFAAYVVRSGQKFFDFRSMSELLDKADRLLDKVKNPFRALAKNDRQYIDCLAAVRNNIVHGSDAAGVAYSKHLNSVYNIKYAPKPGEFLSSIDHRPTSPAPKKPRIHGFVKVLESAIDNT